MVGDTLSQKIENPYVLFSDEAGKSGVRVDIKCERGPFTGKLRFILSLSTGLSFCST